MNDVEGPSKDLDRLLSEAPLERPNLYGGLMSRAEECELRRGKEIPDEIFWLIRDSLQRPRRVSGVRL